MGFSKKGFMMFSAAALTLAACNGDEESSSGGDQIDLRWQTTTGYSPEAPTQGNAEYLRGQLDSFHDENPDVNVSYDLQSSDIDEAMSRLLEQANSGRAPDVAPIDSYLFAQYYEHLQPLNDLFDEYDVNVEDYMPFAQDVITDDDGTIYGLYMNTDTRVLFYDTSVIPEPPSTWMNLLKLAYKYKTKAIVASCFPAVETKELQ
ncbi:sugar ABC transporter, periplasmic sugar-binding protein [Geomicrobium sp. JCM 19039]|nr:extracellular solute-binding protein [Geomicrobium sp. JCM 19039]GAK13238.1 sugar ABC transporter, periplasmic sugar-binding protein [Geomicrobium sp. JCM 19039]